MKTLFINRHAKSSWIDNSLSDFERPLNARGKRDAPIMAKLFASREKQVDAIVSSPANRALATATTFAKAMDWSENRILQNDSIYAAGLFTLIDLISGFDDNWNNVIIFGHNPGFSQLVEELSGEYLNMPTCGIAKITFKTDKWSEAAGMIGDLEYSDMPKNHLQ